MSASPTPEGVLRRLEWTVIRRLDGLLHGDYRTLFRGYGLDLADLREYQYHDDVRHIDWNVTARLQTPYVREFNEEREVAAWFLLDLSPRWTSARESVRKRAVSSEFVTVLARLLTRHGNRVGALFYGGEVDTVIPTRSGRRHVLHILHEMLKRPVLTQSQPTDLNDAAARGLRRHPPPLARVHRLRLHQPAGLGGDARASRAAPRGDRRAPVRSARAGDARPRAAGDPGCGNGRAGLRRHPRQGLPQALRGARQASARRNCARRSGAPASMRSSSRPTTISSTRSCASPICASGAASSRPAAACRSTWGGMSAARRRCAKALQAAHGLRGERIASSGHCALSVKDFPMTFLWPDILWLLVVRAAAGARLLAAAAPQEEARGPLREPCDGQGRDGRAASASAAMCRRSCSWSRSR